MWTCEEDILKDIASLTHFGVSENTAPYQIIYSTGRGSRREPKQTETFIDPRNGEPFDLNDINYDMAETHCRSKGRGTGISSLIKSSYELQKQLRMARPLGSGDGAAESYFRRHTPPGENTYSKASKSDCKINDRNEKLQSKPKKSTNSSFPDIAGQRLKATRSSKSHSNALMFALLSKDKANLNIITDIKNDTMPKTNTDIYPNTSNFNNCDTSNNKNNFLELEKDIESQEQEEVALQEKDSQTDQVHNRNETSNKECKLGNQCLNFSTKNKHVSKKLSVSEDSNNLDSILENLPDFNQTSEKTLDQNEKYKRLGERLNKKMYKKSTSEGLYDFTQFYKYISPVKEHSNLPFGTHSTSLTKDFHLSNDEFPPL